MLRYQMSAQSHNDILGPRDARKLNFKFPTANKISDSSMPKTLYFSINYFEII